MQATFSRCPQHRGGRWGWCLQYFPQGGNCLPVAVEQAQGIHSVERDGYQFREARHCLIAQTQRGLGVADKIKALNDVIRQLWMRGKRGGRLLKQLRRHVAAPEVHHATPQTPQQERVPRVFRQELLIGITGLTKAASLFELMELQQLRFSLLWCHVFQWYSLSTMTKKRVLTR